ncbi:MAG: phosphate ABC transporter permease PstA [Firmicutes bacterium]|nr:phosphate ABC transporter permease PstA [Bacillota bacterium]
MKVINLKNNFHKKEKKIVENFLRILIYSAAILTCLVLISIMFYIFLKGLSKVNFNFLSNIYSESSDIKGILPMIINTLYVVIITLIISIPLGIGSAIYLTQYTKKNFFNKIIVFTSSVLSGVPSIILGLFGYSIFCIKFKLGISIISGCLTMFLCVLPIIIKTSEEALRDVPNEYREAAIALGIKNHKIIFEIILPAAVPGMLVSVSLCIGRILGESAALIYTLGMAYGMPKGIFSHIFSSGRTLTLHLYQISKQANTEDSFDIAFATASVLLIFTLILNLVTDFFLRGFFKNTKR